MHRPGRGRQTSLWPDRHPGEQRPAHYYLATDAYPTNRWMRCFATKVHAPFILSKAVLTDMSPRCSGAIVNISSGAAIGPGRGPFEDKSVRGGMMYGTIKARP
jgi:citronellol/citronellal dehydrogenase